MPAPASQLTVFSWLFTEFDTVLNNYISETAADIIGAIAPVAWIMMGIYFVLWGFSMIRGLIDEPVTDALFRLLKLAVVLGLALNVGLYQTYIVDFFMQTPDAMASVLAFGGTASEGEQGTYESIDMILNRTVDTATTAWNKMSVLDPGQSLALAFCAILILIFGGGFTIVAGVMIIMAKVAMVMLLALGPIFIMLMMFQSTKRFGELWIAQVLNYMLLLILILAVVTLFFGLCDQALKNAASTVGENPLEALATVGVVCLACAALLFQVAPIASAIAGGVALATTSAVRRLPGAGGVGTAARLGAGWAGGAAGGMASKAMPVAGAAARAVGSMFRASNQVSKA